MASNLRVDNIQPSVGMGIGIGTANGSVTFNADVTGGMNITTGSVGVGTDNPTEKLDVNGALKVYANANIATFKNNQLRSDAAGAYYFDHGTTGQSFTFRTSTSSSLDTTGPSVTSAGNISFPSGNGIDFSATSDASGMGSELLNDYEEGTWTPDLRGSTAGTGSFSPNVAGNGGIYRKVGGIVYIQGNLRGTWTNGTASGNVEIIGLPIANRGTVSGEYNANYGPVNISYHTGLTPSTSGYYVQGGLVIQGSTIMHLYANNGNGGGQVNLTITDVSTANDGVNWHFSATYASA